MIFLSLTICFASTVFGLPTEEQYLEFHNKNFDKVKKSLINFFEIYSFTPILKDGLKTISLDKDPIQVAKTDKFQLTLLGGTMKQEQTNLYCLFLVQQELTSYNSNAILLYTTDQKQYMPSVYLFSEVYKQPFIDVKKFSHNPGVHITTTNVTKEGSYVQEWLFYKNNETKKFKLLFIPDEDGGANFGLLE